MLRLRSFAFALMVFFVTPACFSGCSILLGWFQHPKAEEAPPPAPKSDYDRLAEKAEKGDTDAARKLAQWCYVHDADNERMKYWLQVAARGGDKAAERISEQIADWR